MKYKRFWLVVLALILTMILSFSFSGRGSFHSDILSELKIPREFSGWTGEMLPDNYLRLEDQKYDFINSFFGAEYVREGEDYLIFTIVDADHFHHPKVCYSGAGYEIREIQGHSVSICENKNLELSLYRIQKKEERFFMAYWICTDKELTDWSTQLRRQFWNSLTRKDSVSFMMKIEIPFDEGKEEDALQTLDAFIREFCHTMPSPDKEFFFGALPPDQR